MSIQPDTKFDGQAYMARIRDTNNPRVNVHKKKDLFHAIMYLYIAKIVISY